jgi:hypothetical protein
MRSDLRCPGNDVGAIIVSMLYTQLLTVVRWSEGGLECIIAGACPYIYYGIYVQI